MTARAGVLVTVALLLGGCDSRTFVVGHELSQVPEEEVGNVSPPSSCAKDDFLEMRNACIVDSLGRSYAMGGDELTVIPADVGYGVYLRFKPDVVPLGADVSTDGPAASVRAYAVPYSVLDQRCCPEDDEANRVPATATLDGRGGLLVAVATAPETPTQVSVQFHYPELFGSRLAPPDGSPCDLADLYCQSFSMRGWSARFYVGAVVPRSEPDYPN
jgi:hypothetical protein